MSKSLLDHFICFITVGEKVERLQEDLTAHQISDSDHFKEVVHNDTCAKCEGIRNAQHEDVTGQLDDIKQILLKDNGATPGG